MNFMLTVQVEPAVADLEQVGPTMLKSLLPDAPSFTTIGPIEPEAVTPYVSVMVSPQSFGLRQTLVEPNFTELSGAFNIVVVTVRHEKIARSIQGHG